MRLPPTRGQCHAVFLLVHVASLGSRSSRDEWVATARGRTTIAALSYDLGGAADALVDWGLADVASGISIKAPLCHMGGVADFSTLKAIAGVLLRRRPPIWLRVAIVNDELRPELIPSDDMKALEWLGDDLEAVLVAVYKDVCEPSDGAFLAKLGLAGELAVMSALSAQGRSPRHVSLISDGFGYDVECGDRFQVEGIEVKTAITRTSQRLFLSRNEYDVSRQMGERWKIVQVIFSSRIVSKGYATSEDIELIRELSSAGLRSLAPQSEQNFRWLESAMFTPTDDLWIVSDLTVLRSFRTELAV